MATRRITTYEEDVKRKMLGEIIASGINGIYQKDLIEKIYGNKTKGRTTVFERAGELEDEGLIRIIREKNRVKYISTDKASIDTGTVGHLLGSRFATFVFGKGIGSQDAVITIPEGVKINYSNAEEYRRMSEPIHFTHNMSIEEAIDELSNQIGGYLIYNFIQSMSLDNYSSILRSQYPKRNVDSILKEEKSRHMLSDIWIRSTITSHIKRFKSGFRHVLRRYGYVPDLTTTEGRKKRRALGDYLLDKDAIKELLRALDKSYPDMYKLERYRNKLINNWENIEWYKSRRNYLKGKQKNRNKNENKK